MSTQTLFWILLAAIVSVPIFLWITTIIKRTFSPVYGEEYQVVFFGLHLFTIKQADPNAKWYQRLPFYILFWPFNIASFIYEWVQEMTYEEYLEKKEIAKTKKDYAVSIVWQPKYKESELDNDGIPLDKTVTILVSRKERLKSLREIEGFTLASEFETSDSFRGWRLFTLLFEIKDMSKIISKFRHWQRPATLTFKGEYNSWSKKVDYKTLRTTTMNQLSVSLGKSTDKPFIDEINEKTIEFGYIVNSIKEGEIYLAAETQDMLESQEQKKKAQDKLDAEEIVAKTTEVKAEADAKRIKTVEGAKTKVIEERTTIAVNAAKELSTLAVNQNKSKFGEGGNGLSGMRGVYVEGQNGDGATVNTEKVVEGILALKINENQGGI